MTASKALAAKDALRSWTWSAPLVEKASWLVLGTMGLIFGLGWAVSGSRPVDALLYWNTELGHLYGSVWADDAESFFVYPPPLAQVMVFVRVVGWPAFISAWTLVLFLATAYMGRAWALLLVLIALALLPFYGFEHPLRSPLLYPLIGNIQPLLAAAVVAGFRFPGLWSIILLTKIGPGIGCLWFAIRGEWHSFGQAVIATVVIAAVSFIAAPGLWGEFLEFAARNAGSPAPIGVVPLSFPLRAAMSLGLLVWGARTDRRWTVPIAAGWSAIALYDWTFIEFWVAAPVLWAWDRSARRRDLDTGGRLASRPAQ